jgi:hypothetical protein
MTPRPTHLWATLILLVVPLAAVAQYPNIQVSGPPFPPDPEEVTISINPVNPLNLAAGSNLNYYYYSFDGGWTWTQDRLTSSFNVWGDPCVGFDADGNLYYAHLSWPGVIGGLPGDWLDRIVVQKSTDGGVTWDDGVGVGLNWPKHQDKEWLSADLTNSPYRNNLYLAWTEFDDLWAPEPADSSRIVASRSADHGATWTTPVRVSELGGLCYDDDDTVEGAVPAVGPNGEVYLSWAGHELIFFDKSLDGGVTWGTDAVVTTQPGGWNFDIPGIYRCNGFPITLCDVSNSPYRGHVYIVFSDQRNGLDDTDVFFVKSTDGGSTWTSPAQVIEESSPAHQFFPWATIDPVTGIVYVVFYDRRYLTGNATEVFVSMSEDGGSTWSDFEVSATPFTPQADVFFGDYINIAALNGKVYPIWTRMDSGDMTVWVALVDVPTATETASSPLGAGVELMQNRPNPFNPSTTIAFTIPVRSNVELAVYDVEGRRVRTLINGTLAGGSKQVTWDGRDTRGAMASSGVYFYTLRAGRESITKKMVLLK